MNISMPGFFRNLPGIRHIADKMAVSRGQKLKAAKSKMTRNVKIDGLKQQFGRSLIDRLQQLTFAEKKVVDNYIAKRDRNPAALQGSAEAGKFRKLFAQKGPLAGLTTRNGKVASPHDFLEAFEAYCLEMG